MLVKKYFLSLCRSAMIGGEQEDCVIMHSVFYIALLEFNTMLECFSTVDCFGDLFLNLAGMFKRMNTLELRVAYYGEIRRQRRVLKKSLPLMAYWIIYPYET
jgi:hypothetical protein